GTLRDTSGLTTPVTLSSGAASCAVAVASGNCSGWSTRNALASPSCSTIVGGGAPAAASPVLPRAVQPAAKPAHAMIATRPTQDGRKTHLTKSPLDPQQDSIDSPRSKTPQRG